MERAALSISNNIAEGFERGTTNELLSFLYIARGSAGEVRSMLRVLEGWSEFNNLKSQIADLRGRSERISKQLYGWIESLKNADIPGQRRLDEKARKRYTSRKEREEFLDELQRIRDTAAQENKSEILRFTQNDNQSQEICDALHWMAPAAALSKRLQALPKPA